MQHGLIRGKKPLIEKNTAIQTNYITLIIIILKQDNTDLRKHKLHHS